MIIAVLVVMNGEVALIKGDFRSRVCYFRSNTVIVYYGLYASRGVPVGKSHWHKKLVSEGVKQVVASNASAVKLARAGVFFIGRLDVEV